MAGLPAVWIWSRIHRISSLLCTVILLVSCVTGLPLIFHSEIDAWLGALPRPLSSGAPAPIDAVVRAGLERYPQEVVQFIVWEPDKPGIVTLSMAQTPTADPSHNHYVEVDAYRATVIESHETFLDTVLKLHSQLFAGPLGSLVLGGFALAFLVSLISGVVVYAPFMRRIPYGTVRYGRSPRLRWLDQHNLVGVTLAAWMVVVGFTGWVNAWGDSIFQLWRAGQLAEMTQAYHGKPPPQRLIPVGPVLDTARALVPAGRPYVVAYPGSLMSSAYHYAVFLRGSTPLTEHLLRPVLIDAQTGALTDTRDPPWFIQMLLLSQPLHFGDYGGLALKLLWVMLDLLTISVLVSGIALWWPKGRQPAMAAETGP